MAKKGSKKQEAEEEKPEEQTGKVEVIIDEAFNKENVLFVPDDEKIERVKKQVRADRIVKDRIALDFWLRHELQLGTGQIKKLWIKMDNVYRK